MELYQYLGNCIPNANIVFKGVKSPVVNGTVILHLWLTSKDGGKKPQRFRKLGVKVGNSKVVSVKAFNGYPVEGPVEWLDNPFCVTEEETFLLSQSNPHLSQILNSLEEVMLCEVYD